MRTGRPPLVDFHGTITGYRNRGCTCDACLAAHRRAVKSYRVRTRADRRGSPSIRATVPAAPVRAHLAALVASGYTLRQVATETGASRAAVQRIAAGDRTRVSSRIATLVFMLEPLPDLTGYVDPVTVDRLVAAYPDQVWRGLGATREERIEAAYRLDGMGHQARTHLTRRGFGDQQIEAPSRNGIEVALGLRWGRDLDRREAAS